MCPVGVSCGVVVDEASDEDCGGCGDECGAEGEGAEGDVFLRGADTCDEDECEDACPDEGACGTKGCGAHGVFLSGW